MITPTKPFDLKDREQVNKDLKECKPLVQKYVKWLEDRLIKANILLSLHDDNI